MRLKYIIPVFVLSLLTAYSISARQPAVEHVAGISIEDEKAVAPSKAIGYKFKPNFKETNRKLAAAKNTNTGVKEVQLESTDNAMPIVFILFLTLLPVIIWFSIIRGLKDQETQIIQGDIPENVKFLKDYQDDDDDDDSGIPKAS